MAKRFNGGNGEPLDRFLRRMLARWENALDRIAVLEKRADQTMKYLLRREQRDQERWKEDKERWDGQQRRWDEQQRRWDEQQRRWDEQQRRWDENQRVLREILARLPKPS